MRVKTKLIIVLSAGVSLIPLLSPLAGTSSAANPMTAAVQYVAQAKQQDDQRGDVYSPEFISARPAGKNPTSRKFPYRIKKQRLAAAQPAKAGAVAKTKQSPATLKGKLYSTVGVTTGRGRPATTAEIQDENVAKIKLKDGRLLVLARASGDQPVAHGDLIQMTIEYLAYSDVSGKVRSDRVGYLYVINRVEFPGGEPGPPRLIFPTNRTYGGDNRVLPGKTVILPGPERPWQISRSRTGKTQAFETYIIIVSPEPLKDSKGNDLAAENLTPELLKPMVDKWLRSWGGDEMEAELIGGSGRLITSREQSSGGNPEAASRDTDEVDTDLTQDDLPPQTVFRKEVNAGEAMLVTVRLPFIEAATAPKP